MKVFKNGLLTGLILQCAIGPVFFFILSLALQKTLYDGFAAVIAVTLVDYFYITLAILGVGAFVEKGKTKKVFGIISSIVLIVFGMIIMKHTVNESGLIITNTYASDLRSSFTSAFFLTISSPMTIVFWTSLFAAKAAEYNYTKRELLIFGISTGLATLIFLGTSVILLALIKKTVPLLLIWILNVTVGCLLISYGIIRLKTGFKENG